MLEELSKQLSQNWDNYQESFTNIAYIIADIIIGKLKEQGYKTSAIEMLDEYEPYYQREILIEQFIVDGYNISSIIIHKLNDHPVHISFGIYNIEDSDPDQEEMELSKLITI